MNKVREELIKKGLIVPGDASAVKRTESTVKPMVVARKLIDDRPVPKRAKQGRWRGLTKKRLA